MKEKNLHIIKKQFIHLDVSRKENSLALRQRFERLLEEELLPRLEPVFDRLAGPDVWIELDRLEFDLGRLDSGASSSDWLEKTYRAYVAALEEQVQKYPEDKRRSSSENFRRALVFFLREGYLPWWAYGLDLETAVREQLSLIAAFLLNVLNEPQARRRWVRQFDDDIQELLWKERTKGSPDRVAPDLERPIGLQQWRRLEAVQSGRELRNLYWESVWQTLQTAAGFERAWPLNLLRLTLNTLPGQAAKATFWQRLWRTDLLPVKVKQILFKELEADLPLPFQHWRRWLPSRPAKEQKKIYGESLLPVLQREAGYEEKWLRLLLHNTVAALPAVNGRKILQEKIRQDPDLPDERRVRLLFFLEQPQSLVTPQQPGISDQKKEEEIPSTASPRSRKMDEGEGIFVPLAGTVLLHSFLPAFFERLDLLEEGRFREEADRERAVHLLYFLATGLKHPAEQELVVLKLLSGMEIDRPVEKKLDLTEKEKEAADQLLRAVIQTWEVMAGSDPDDLRGSFLIREGKVQTGEMGWKLTVEQQSYDILLNQLPWGLSPIMHSWMGEMIWVEWG
jgi:hypothetical protein